MGTGTEGKASKGIRVAVEHRGQPGDPYVYLQYPAVPRVGDEIVLGESVFEVHSVRWSDPRLAEYHDVLIRVSR